jgi:acetyl-CoA C-acetyltransferase
MEVKGCAGGLLRGAARHIMGQPPAFSRRPGLSSPLLAWTGGPCTGAPRGPNEPGSPYQRNALSSEELWLFTDRLVNQTYVVPQGYDIFAYYNGWISQAYAKKYGYTIEEFDRGMFEVCRIRRLHASLNPKAIQQQTLEEEGKYYGFDDVFAFWGSRFNPMVAWPSRIRSCVTPADGASAIIVSSKDAIGKRSKMPIQIKGFGGVVSDHPLVDTDPTCSKHTEIAFGKAYAMANIRPEQVQYMHTHDCSNIAGLVYTEIGGYLPQGESLKYAQEGRLRFDGDKPMSTHGGRHGFGHAWAASGGSDIYEAVRQMRGDAGKTQIKSVPRIASLHIEGYAMVSCVMVLEGV